MCTYIFRKTSPGIVFHRARDVDRRWWVIRSSYVFRHPLRETPFGSNLIVIIIRPILYYYFTRVHNYTPARFIHQCFRDVL